MLYRIIHIVIIVTVLFSSAGYVVNKHYCQSVLKDTALYTTPKSCHSLEKEDSCEHHQEKSSCHQTDEPVDNCCNNQSDYYKLKQDQQTVSLEFSALNHPVLLNAIMVSLSQLIPENVFFENSYFLSYKPPIVGNDFQSMLQTYRL